MKKLLFLVLAVSIHLASYAADGFSTLEERMSGKEFQETGLGKLSSDELAALNDWLRRHSVATLENAMSIAGTDPANNSVKRDMRGFPNQPDDDSLGDVINGNIVGTFDGWTGTGSVFTLTNGMIWQQDEKDSFYVEPVENAAVIIEKGFMGRWYLSMLGQKKKVKVKRIQ
jgi:hypothetical protein